MEKLKSIQELDYSNYKLPNSMSEENFKLILSCQYPESKQMSIYEIYKRIDILNEFLKLNGEDYNLSEFWWVGNMISNYKYDLNMRKEGK